MFGEHLGLLVDSRNGSNSGTEQEAIPVTFICLAQRDIDSSLNRLCG